MKSQGQSVYAQVTRQILGYDGTLMLEILYGKGEGNSTEPTYRDFALKAKLAAERVIETVKKYRS